MGASAKTSEIVELIEELDTGSRINKKASKHYMQTSGQRCSIEDDINRLFQGINIRISSQSHGASRDALRKSAMKRPIRAGSSGIGISEPMSLKQALRGLCISQAAEMAAMKRLTMATHSSEVSESGTIKKLYRAVVVEANGSRVAINEGKGNLVKITLVPDGAKSNFSSEVAESVQEPTAEPSYSGSQISIRLDNAIGQEATMKKLTPQGPIGNLPIQVGSKIPKEEVEELRSPESTSVDKKKKLGSVHSISSSGPSIKPSNSTYRTSHFLNPTFRTKNLLKKKAKLGTSSSSSVSNLDTGKFDPDLGPGTKNSMEHEKKGIEKASLESSSKNLSNEVNSSMLETSSETSGLSSSCSITTASLVTNSDATSRSREKGQFSRSLRSSIGDYSSSPSIGGESFFSVSSRSGNRAHLSKDLRWEAIHSVQKQPKSMGLRNFKVLRRLGVGDIGTVYLAELSDTNCLFALKVMDKEFLGNMKKMVRAQTEREILQMLDHPFLPTLYAHFETDKLSCLVIDYCPGGDLHVLPQKQLGKNFPEQVTRFYVSEVLLALEYLHMLGVVYRDLKPENILVREDGHIMLTDFDLSLKCSPNPTVLKSSSPTGRPTKSPCSSGCINPFCLQPSWNVPCFTPKLLEAKTQKMKSDLPAQVNNPLPQLVVEPTSARSNSFVGTHEYLAPEIVKGEGHGSAVDWWTYGIFMYELLYGKTPFKGSGNEETLANIVSQNLKFPDSPIASFHARDLIRCLLVKEPESRLGSMKGAAEIKQHPFFEGLNWALIRCAVPPEMPKISDVRNGGLSAYSRKKDCRKGTAFESMREEDAKFDMF